MNPRFYGARENTELLSERLTKMTVRLLGQHHCGYKRTAGPRNPMRPSVGGVADLDEIDLTRWADPR